MKTKELIAELQRIDPDGEGEVCVDNRDIYYVAREPAYWDGRLQRLVIDETKKPYWCIAGGKFVSRGDKISIQALSLFDLATDDPDTPVEFDEGSKCYEEMIENCRHIGRAIQNEQAIPGSSWHVDLAEMVLEHGLGRVVKALDLIAGEHYRRLTT